MPYNAINVMFIQFLKGHEMEHFPIVQALCRSALAHPSAAVKKQVERLAGALQKVGDEKQAASLLALLVSSERNVDAVPSRVEQSRGRFVGEQLPRHVSVPVDKETAAPLVQVVFPTEINPIPPVFSRTVDEAIGTVIADWRHIEELEAVGVAPARSALIYGEPGTGKTRLAMWMARSLGLPVVLARLDGLMSSYLGTTARNIGNLFAFANRYQCVLLLDEFDAIAKLRDDPQEVGEIKRVVNALLQNLDVRKEVGFTLAVTNHPALLDPAIWRRFEIQLEMPKPDAKARLQIIHSFMSPVSPPDSHIRLLAWASKETTGAEIEMLVRAYKRSTVIASTDSQTDLITTLKNFAVLNSARMSQERKTVLFSDLGVLFKSLKSDDEFDFSLSEIGEIAGKDKSTISRQMGKPNN